MEKIELAGDTASLLVGAPAAGHDESDTGIMSFAEDVRGCCLLGDRVISLMMVDLSLLAFAAWFAMRLLRAARQQGRPSSEDGLHPEFATVLIDLASEPETPALPDGFAPFEAENPMLTFAAEVSISSLDQANQDDLYADPIDGVPFTAGEEIHTCRCGVGYRQESLRWIEENLSGQCVHCGVAMDELQVVAVSHAGPREVRVQ